jgi:hypothetical protein
MDAADFERLGLYDPTAPDADTRLGLLRYLVRSPSVIVKPLVTQRNSPMGSFGLSTITDCRN